MLRGVSRKTFDEYDDCRGFNSDCAVSHVLVFVLSNEEVTYLSVPVPVPVLVSVLIVVVDVFLIVV
jgi:hypothetical protein